MIKSAFVKEIKKYSVNKNRMKYNTPKTLEEEIILLKKERHSLKSQLGHSLKEFKNLEVILNNKNSILKKKEKELKLANLEIIKRDLMEKHMVNICFRKHIVVYLDMNEKEIEKNILIFKSSLEIFKNEILKNK